ncbi:hypothetical protein X739_05665 [Mesorhizobium sp. LNHC220B00]|nr:hypothetical protein X739_05665 [Mesorhizobium sp. LNHC220B00]
MGWLMRMVRSLSMPPPDTNGDPKAVVVFTREGSDEFVLARWAVDE